MSENTVNAALRRMGYSTDEMTGHGFRSLGQAVKMRIWTPLDEISLIFGSGVWCRKEDSNP